MILELHRQGLKVAVIARQLGIDRKTVRKYISRGLEPPTYRPRRPELTCCAFDRGQELAHVHHDGAQQCVVFDGDSLAARQLRFYLLGRSSWRQRNA